MAKLQVFTYDNLALYDELIKGYINEQDAKSLKTIVFNEETNTIEFYREEEPLAEGTTPAYSVELPEVDFTEVYNKISEVEGKVTKNTEDIAALDERVEAVEGAVEAINDEATGILAQAKAYADGKDEAIAAAKKAGDDAQADVDALEEVVAGMYTNTQIDEAIEAAKTAATYDDTEIKTSIKANADAIDAIEADYLKAADKTELSDAIDALEGVVDGKADKATTLAGYGITDAYTKTEADTAIANAVASAGHLKREIVDALPEVAEADKDIIYMVAIVDGEGNQKYEEFMLINDAFEKIGDTAVSLEGYATEGYVDTAKQEAIDAAATDATTKADKALEDAKDYADSLAGNYDAAGTAEAKVKELADGAVATNTADIEALQGLVGDGYEPIPPASIEALFTTEA